MFSESFQLHMLVKTTTSRLFLLLSILLLSVLIFSGCMYSREISHIRRDIEREFPGAEFEKEFVISIGPGFFDTVGWLAKLVDDDDVHRIGDYLNEIRRVKVGVYRTEQLPFEGDLELESLQRFSENGWELAVKVQDEQEIVWVLYREWYDEVRDMFILVLDDEDLIIVRIEGYLNRLLQKIVEDETYATRLLD